MDDSFKKILDIKSCRRPQYEKNRKYFTRPRLIGVYDIDYDKFSPTKKIRYRFKEPDLSSYPLNLNLVYGGFRTLKHETQSNLFLPLLHLISNGMESMSDDEDNYGKDVDVERTDVFTRRGILENIMEFYYSKKDFDVLVSRYNGKVYMVKQPPVKDEFERGRLCSHHECFIQQVFIGKFI